MRTETNIRTETKLWSTFYEKLGEVDPTCPTENRVIEKTMSPSRYDECAASIIKISYAYPSILEIGCGYGGLAKKILDERQAFYTVVENEPMLSQVKKYLGDRVEYVEASKIKALQDRRFGLFISHYCLSETPPEYREYVLKNIIKNCQKISIIDIDDNHAPTSRMRRAGYEIVPLEIERYLMKYFIVQKSRIGKNQSMYIGERWK